MRFDIDLDGGEPRGTDAAAIGERLRIARCSERDRDQIAQLRDDELPHWRRNDRRIVDQRARIVRQQRQRAGAARNRAQHGIVDIGHEWDERRARQPDDAMVHAPRPGDGARLGVAQQHSIAVLQRHFATASATMLSPLRLMWMLRSSLPRPASACVCS